MSVWVVLYQLHRRVNKVTVKLIDNTITNINTHQLLQPTSLDLEQQVILVHKIQVPLPHLCEVGIFYILQNNIVETVYISVYATPTWIHKNIVSPFFSEEKVVSAKCKFPSQGTLWEYDSWRCSSIDAYHLCTTFLIYLDVSGTCGPEDLVDEIKQNDVDSLSHGLVSCTMYHSEMEQEVDSNSTCLRWHSTLDF